MVLKRIKFYLIRKLSKLIIYFIFKSSKIKILNQEKIEYLRKEKIPIVYIFWHRHIFYHIYHFRNSGVRPLISESSDGELVSQVAEDFGMNPIRGSSSSGGARAFLEMINTIKEKKSEILITADGPKGPSGIIKEGVIRLAQKTNSAIVPISWDSSKKKIFYKSWDKFILPLPFSKLIFSYGEPIFLKNNEKIDENKDKLKKSLDLLYEKLIKLNYNNSGGKNE